MDSKELRLIEDLFVFCKEMDKDLQILKIRVAALEQTKQQTDEVMGLTPPDIKNCG